MSWHKITEKLAPINEYVFILHAELMDMRIAKLNIYDRNNSNLNDTNFTNGDIYWSILNEENTSDRRHNWGRITSFPYWMAKGDLIPLTLEKHEPKQLEEENDKGDRFDMLDL